LIAKQEMADQFQPRVIRVFVSSLLRDLQGERDYLNRFTFPRLRQLCDSRNVILEVVDLQWGVAEEDPSQESVLRHSLEELQRSRPYYIGLIGERYGRAVEAVSSDLLARWELLTDCQQRPNVRSLSEMSTTELEIVFGVLTDEAMRGRGFFYVRDPRSIDSDAQRREDLAQSAQDAQKMEDLKRSIRDFAKQGVCQLHENYRNTEELGEWILDDFRQLIDKLWPVTESQTEVTRFDDDVMFTVYRPGTVVPQKWYSLLAFAHLAERRPDAPPDEPDPLAEVQRQAQQILGEKISEYRQSSQDSSSSIPHAGEITFQPFITGFEFNPSSRSFRWEESVQREEFKMRVATAPDGEVAKGWLRVYLGPMILAQINLSIKVDSRSVSPSKGQGSAVESARPLRRVFASYSHKDQAIVERIEEVVNQTHLGIEYLRDATKLRAGEEWSPRLKEMIREAQAFQLFWSTNSMHSAFVRQEYEYALSLGREYFVLPVFWETPFPEKPEDGLPPDALRRFHFEKLRESTPSLPQSDAVISKPIAPGSLPPPPPPPMPNMSQPKSPDAERKPGKGPAIPAALLSAAVIFMAAMIGLFQGLDGVGTNSNTNSNSNNRIVTTGRVTGSVVDQAGNPLSGITVSFRNGPQTLTDKDGGFVLNNVPEGTQTIEVQSPAHKAAPQQVKVTGNQTASVNVVYDPGASELGLLSITLGPAEGELQSIFGRCDGLTEILGKFNVWILIRPGNDPRFWVQLPPADIDLNSKTWRARVKLSIPGQPPRTDGAWHIVAVAAASDSKIGRIRNIPNLDRLPTHVRSDVLTVSFKR
jgi:TIR domain/Carboxypeptidase regulatory-like domain/Domain of unknown function (DUF4062)